jgi:hypothetical protein
VTITGMAPAGYNGTFAVASVLSGTQFTVALPANPGTATAFGTVASSALPALNNATQSFLPVGPPFSNVAVTGVTVAAGSPSAVLAGTFTDPYPNTTAGTDTATVDWGDGTTSTAAITGSGGSFTVSASHIFATNGSRIITLTVVDPRGSAASAGYTFTGGLTLDASGNLKNYSSASTFTTVDTGVGRYIPRAADGTVFSLHAGGALWAITGAGAKTQVDGGVSTMALGPDGGLYALVSGGVLQVAPAGSTSPVFSDSGVQALVPDTTGDLYKLSAAGALSVMPAGSSTWTPVLTSVKSATPSGGGVNVLTNAGVDWQYTGAAGTLVAGPHLALTLAGPANAGQAVSATVSVLDVFNNPVLGYTGTVTFTDGDAPAVAAGGGPPARHTFTAADNGAFSFPVTFLTSGPQTLTATDGGGLTASATALVNPGPAAQFSVDPPPVAVNTPAPVTVTAYDAYGNVATGFTGGVSLTSPNGSLPPAS